LSVKWAPLVKLAKGDRWRPSSVDFFLANSKLVNGKGATIKNTLRAYNLPKCDKNCHIRTKASMKSANTNNLRVFYGQRPTKVPVYVFIKQTAREIRLHYAFYYPYNYGKEICIGYQARNMCVCPKFFGNCPCPRVTQCFGVKKRFGNHVGDWENIDVYLNKDGTKKFIDLTAHGDKDRYKWNGKSFKNKDGKVIKFYRGHPIVYSAYGSHGSWPYAGRFVYKKVFGNNELADKTSDGGLKWKTWRNVQIIMVKRKGSSYKGRTRWVNFKGRWGNKKRTCGIYEKISDQCVLNGGPTGPLKNF